MDSLAHIAPPSDYQAQRATDLSDPRLLSAQFEIGLSLFSNPIVGYSLPFQPSLASCDTQQAVGITQRHYTCHIPQLAAPISSSLTATHGMPNSSELLGNALYPQHDKEAKSLQQSSVVIPSSDGPSLVATNSTFKTDVDMLVRTIQTRKASAVCNIRLLGTRTEAFNKANTTSSPAISMEEKTWEALSTNSARPRIKYQCHVSSCAKLFFQKTHLEIHMRAHTGYKPFVGIA